jgi:hypothetical protein
LADGIGLTNNRTGVEMAKVEEPAVWVFCGNNATFPSAVFSQRKDAEEWISRHELSGTLTAYPIDKPAYDWAIETGSFEPKKPKHKTSEFIQKFSSASQEHYHYTKGER